MWQTTGIQELALICMNVEKFILSVFIPCFKWSVTMKYDKYNASLINLVQHHKDYYKDIPQKAEILS